MSDCIAFLINGGGGNYHLKQDRQVQLKSIFGVIALPWIFSYIFLPPGEIMKIDCKVLRNELHWPLHVLTEYLHFYFQLKTAKCWFEDIL